MDGACIGSSISWSTRWSTRGVHYEDATPEFDKRFIDECDRQGRRQSLQGRRHARRPPQYAGRELKIKLESSKMQIAI